MAEQEDMTRREMLAAAGAAGAALLGNQVGMADPAPAQFDVIFEKVRQLQAVLPDLYKLLERIEVLVPGVGQMKEIAGLDFLSKSTRELAQAFLKPEVLGKIGR